MVITDGTLIGKTLQYFKPVGRIKFEYDVKQNLRR